MVSAAVLGIGLLAALPPWRGELTAFGGEGATEPRTYAIRFHGHRPVWKPPTARVDSTLQTTGTYMVDWSRLTLYWVTTAAVGAALVFLLADRRAS